MGLHKHYFGNWQHVVEKDSQDIMLRTSNRTTTTQVFVNKLRWTRLHLRGWLPSLLPTRPETAPVLAHAVTFPATYCYYYVIIIGYKLSDFNNNHTLSGYHQPCIVWGAWGHVLVMNGQLWKLGTHLKTKFFVIAQRLGSVVNGVRLDSPHLSKEGIVLFI